MGSRLASKPLLAFVNRVSDTPGTVSDPSLVHTSAPISSMLASTLGSLLVHLNDICFIIETVHDHLVHSSALTLKIYETIKDKECGYGLSRV